LGGCLNTAFSADSAACVAAAAAALPAAAAPPSAVAANLAFDAAGAFCTRGSRRPM